MKKRPFDEVLITSIENSVVVFDTVFGIHKLNFYLYEKVLIKTGFRQKTDYIYHNFYFTPDYDISDIFNACGV